ncbi:hypothetical protein NDI76_13940 [Halogeometricum sp. S1BR25-6]|uniref:Uncharacterized protein n=1 Tax=Halogeometricum salsisoli TaxID=2950536 RepID=A0ABU2GGB1_9EURY|nr:hypothetical protein [Halogeometricum sp. S1BR25-6]MDS0299845.1 hypothetical protein [Halogeometricum sp. S1BR25-6]
MTKMGRRRFLASVGAGAVGLAAAPGVAAADPREGFDPSVHGFGFRNWRGSERAYPGHDHRRLADEEVRECVRLDWQGPFADLFGTPVARLPDALVGLVASQIRVAAAQLSSTDGHCYGMTFAAQEFFEDPNALPDSVEHAAELRTPEVPRGEGGTVGTRIDEYQSTQLLDVHSWLGRRRMLRPQKIDHAAELAALTATVDAFGTAGVTLVDTATRLSHQVLVYDYAERGDATLLDVYNPNVPAKSYRPRYRRRLKVVPNADRPLANHAEFDSLVFNRWDRAIRADADVTAPRRTDDGDFSHLLERAVRFTVSSPNVGLSVVAPDGTAVGRNRAEMMDRSRGDVYGTRYRYDAPAGDYRVSVVGKRAATYELTAEAAGLDGSLLDDAVTAHIAPGEVREYVASVPESAEEEGALRERATLSPSRVRRAVDVPNLLAGAAGGAALSAYALRRRRE